MSAGQGLLSLIMLVAGLGIPVMAALNGGLGSRLGSPVLAAGILFAVALTCTLGVLLVLPNSVPSHSVAQPLHWYTGGVFVAFYVLSMTWIAPRLGVGNAVALVLLGQTLAASAIDHHGWLDASKSTITPMRGLGVALLVAGVFLSRRHV